MMPTVNIFIDKILKKDFATPKILTDNIFRKLPLGCAPAIEILRNYPKMALPYLRNGKDRIYSSMN